MNLVIWPKGFEKAYKLDCGYGHSTLNINKSRNNTKCVNKRSKIEYGLMEWR